MAKVSIIIPVFNAESFLRQTLQSVKDQTYEDWECIVVDDFSEDNSKTIAEMFSELDNRFAVYSNKIKGGCQARNFGISKASGKYYKFLDADDFIGKAVIAHQVLVLDSCGQSLVAAFCDWKTYSHVKGYGPSRTNGFEKMSFSFEGFYSTLWGLSEMVPTHAWLINRALVSDIQWDESLTINQDGDFFFRALKGAVNIYKSKGTVFYRRDVETSVTKTVWRSRDENVRDSLVVLRRFQSSITANSASEYVQGILKCYYNFVYTYYNSNPKLVSEILEEANHFRGHWKLKRSEVVSGGVIFCCLSKIFGFQNMLVLKSLKDKCIRIFTTT